MAFHIPEEETLEAEGLTQLQREKFSALFAEAVRSNAFYRRKFSAMTMQDPWESFPHLPFTLRDEIEQDQLDHPPYGSNLTVERGHYRRLHQTSGTGGTPLHWLDTAQSWAWWLKCWGILYRAAGLTNNDRVIAPFSFGPFIGFWGAFEAAYSLGVMVLAGGGMTTSARIRHIFDHDVTVVCCTPTYALRMLEVAAKDGVDLTTSGVRMLIVAGEPGGSIRAVRSRIEAGWGARVFDHAGMTEIGPWGFECLEAPGGMHVIESEFIAEVIKPDSNTPVADGETGELVLTNLGRIGSPLIRYRTGDLVTLGRGKCACGRSFARVAGGVLGRKDDMLSIRGNNVFPSAIEGIVRALSGLAEFRLVLEKDGAMTGMRIDVEPQPETDGPTLAREIEEAIRNQLHFRPRVVSVAPGTLPRFEMKAHRVVRERQ